MLHLVERYFARLDRVIISGAVSMVKSGFYRMVFAGGFGSGIGLLAIHEGKIVGVDGGGGEYNGYYSEDAVAGTATIHLEVTIPSNMPIVTGERARAEPWTLPIDVTLRANFANGIPINITTSYGMINVSFSLLRPL
jgi:hypothetical protein